METIDAGTAYGRPAGTHNAALTEVGPGTPMGELLRRYWHPVGLVSDATDTPKQIQALGEELILFRDNEGRPGLVHPHCSHRGASLFYGRVEARGIRCCYHGWLFDVQGNCLEQPCEPNGGKNLAVARQPWYPVQELYGLIWVYMGPPEKKPVLPRYACLENLAPGEFLEVNDASIGSGGPTIVPCNWLQHYENIVDPFHVPILHGSFSGVQFVELMGQMPDVEFSYSPMGVRVTSRRTTDDGKLFVRVTECGIPTLRLVPNPRIGAGGPIDLIGWVLPINDTTYRIYTVGKVRTAGQLKSVRSRLNGRLWEELSEDEHQKLPGDYEAQTSQGPIALHSEEHLAMSDRGIVMLRRLLQKQVEAIAEGKDPMGVSFDPDAPPIELECGNFFKDE